MQGTSASARFFSPYGVAVSPDGKTVYVGEAYKNRIRAVSVDDGVITTLAGSGNRGGGGGLRTSCIQLTRSAGNESAPGVIA